MAENEQNAKRENSGYEVGKGRPPIEHQFQPGNQAGVGHRNGKGPQLLAALRRIMRAVEPADKDGRKRAEIAALSLYQQAVKGNGTAIKQLWDRLCGPVPNVHEGGDPEKPILIADARNKLLSRIGSIAERTATSRGDREPD